MKYSTSVLVLILLLLNLSGCSDDDKQVNNNNGEYQSVTIGNQAWMKNNFDAICYRNGDTIPQVKDPEEWKDLTTGAWCYYENDEQNGALYGKLYNWYAVNHPRGLAPDGWHIPSYYEWTELVDFLGGDSLAGGKMKEAGVDHWEDPNIGATNESGFSALPGGVRLNTGNFISIGYSGKWWSTSEYEGGSIWGIWLQRQYESISMLRYSKTNGHSVRCIKD